jgi:predicted anti-sigma-YlaC factor YlaD
MECKEIRKQLADYLLDELESKQEIRISEHLVHCKSCRQEVEALENLFGSIKDEQHAEPSGRILDRIRIKIGISGALTPLLILRKPIRLYHALATLLLGIILATLSNAVIEKRTLETETIRTPYRVIHEAPMSDSITFYTAPSHRLGGT